MSPADSHENNASPAHEDELLALVVRLGRLEEECARLREEAATSGREYKAEAGRRADLEVDLDRARAWALGLEESLSWRLTAPLRRGLNRVRTIAGRS